jgi:hypothetical protein
MKEYQRLKELLLPTAEKVLNENVFPDEFKSAFFKHLVNLHSQLLF